MKVQRIKTNIVELSKLKETHYIKWLRQFKDDKIDIHKEFLEHGEQYEWLYRNSNYDLIGWEIENGVFDWEKMSWAVARYCPEHLDPEKFNWKDYSIDIAQYCPDKLDPERYNWEKDSWAVARYCPYKLYLERYNWEKDSWAIARYCPQHLDPQKYNWREFKWTVAEFCPEKLNLMHQE